MSYATPLIPVNIRLTDPVLVDYKQRLEMNNYTDYTVRDYLKFLKRVLEFNRKREVRALTGVDISLFLQYLQQEGIAPRSIYKYTCAARVLINTYRLPIDLRDLPKVRLHIQPHFTVLSPDQIQQIVLQAPSSRDKSIIWLAYECALRVGEVRNILRDDLDLEKAVLYVRTEKWGPKTSVPIYDPRLIEMLRIYISEWDIKRGAPLFPKTQGHRNMIRPTYISTHIFRDRVLELGYKGVRFHDLRHSRATHLLEGGMDSLILQKFMRHKNLASTQIYVHPDTESLRSHIARALNRGAS